MQHDFSWLKHVRNSRKKVFYLAHEHFEIVADNSQLIRIEICSTTIYLSNPSKYIPFVINIDVQDLKYLFCGSKDSNRLLSKLHDHTKMKHTNITLKTQKIIENSKIKISQKWRGERITSKNTISAFCAAYTSFYTYSKCLRL